MSINNWSPQKYQQNDTKHIGKIFLKELPEQSREDIDYSTLLVKDTESRSTKRVQRETAQIVQLLDLLYEA